MIEQLIRYINTKDARDENHVIQSMKIQFIENTDFFIKIENTVIKLE